MRSDEKTLVICVLAVAAISIAAIVMHAPRTSPECERVQRVTAPWLTGQSR